MNAPATVDLLVIGGGINGAGIARDAAGRGLSVLLAEQDDLASATSSASTKLIHGGLRYLEYYEFRLVSEALAERETLLTIAPHIIWPLEFVLPHEPHLRPAWMIRLGLFLYDTLGGRTRLPRSRGVKLLDGGYGAGLKPGFSKGFRYADCWVDDARLVTLNARDAAARGATILTRTRVSRARREGDAWVVTLDDRAGTRELRARMLVNAAGPWVKRVLDETVSLPSPGKVRLVKGSHIVVPRIHDLRHAYILQNPDRRIVFMIPYERAWTLVGTTDVPVEGSAPEAQHPQISADEVAYLCEAASRYSARPITPEQVVWRYSGVRPLFDDGSDDPSAVTRDYHLMLDAGETGQGAPLLSVFGGKITTYRRLAEEVLSRLAPWMPGAGEPWTHAAALPGGDFGDFDALMDDMSRRYPGLGVGLLVRMARRHGTLAKEILGSAKTEADLGENFGGGLFQAEVDWLRAHEWARTGADVMWRRTKCGLHMNAAQRRRTTQYMESTLGNKDAAA